LNGLLRESIGCGRVARSDVCNIHHANAGDGRDFSFRMKTIWWYIRQQLAGRYSSTIRENILLWVEE